MKSSLAAGLLFLTIVAFGQQYAISTLAGGVPPPTPVTAVNASIGSPVGSAMDAGGNLYFISLNCVFKLDRSGVLTRIAGNARTGYSGDGGLATNAQFANPTGLALDGAGNIYIADPVNQRIRKVSPNGTITTVAGSGLVPDSVPSGEIGDGGQAVNAILFYPDSVVIDSSGNLYIADEVNDRIRQVSPNGIITTVVGNGTGGYSGDGGLATSAQINFPAALTLDSAGSLYIADAGNNRIRKIAPSGIITTVAGNGASGFSGDGGLATSALLAGVTSLAVDATGSLYIADSGNDRVRKVTTGGIISTVAGNGTNPYPGAGAPIGDGAQAINAQLYGPAGLAVDGAGNLYIADEGTYRIRKIAPSGIITTVAGNGTGSYSGDNSSAESAQLFRPQGLTLDTSGNLYVGDEGNNRVRKITPGRLISTFAGNGTWGNLGDAGPATNAYLLGAWGVVFDSLGNLYISDYGFDIRKVSPVGTITRFAGNGSAGYSGDGGSAVTAQLDVTGGLATDSSNNLYIADVLNNRVRKVSAIGTITTIAGSGNLAGYSGDGGLATRAQLSYPADLAVDSADNLYIADSGNYRVRKVSPSGLITTVAGSGINGYSGDGGPATSAELGFPEGLAVDSVGDLYIVDGARIRKVSPNGIIATVAGTGTGGYSGDGGAALSAELTPSKLVADTFGNIFISESSNNAVRVLQPVTGAALPNIITSPQLPTGTVGRSYSQRLAVTGGATPYSWSVTTGTLPAGLSLSGAGTISGVPSTPGSATFTVQVLDSRSFSASQTFTLAIAPGISISSITNAASNLSGSISPGEIVVLYGSGLGPAQLVEATVGGDGLYDKQLVGTTLSFNGIGASLIYAWATQVAAIVPYGVSGSTAQVTLTYQGQTTSAFPVPIAASAPGIFSLDSTGTGQAAAFNQDGITLNTLANPAKIGGIVSLYVTGEGQTSPSGVDGKPAAVPYPQPNLPVTVTIGGQTVIPQYAGGAPGEVAGVMQINVQIPSGIQAGNVPVVLRIGNASSQSGVTIAVKGN